jgi:hypothetical protein
VSEGHPVTEPTNNIYHFYYENSAFYSMNGNKIASVDMLPIRPEQCDLVYDGHQVGVRSWIWDAAIGGDGRPVAAYARFPSNDRHNYRYVRWSGSQWVDRQITDGGGWFPQTPLGQREREPYYSGGVVLDHSDPRFVFLSKPVNGTFQIQRWFTRNHGDHWSASTFAQPQGYAAVRPVVARGTRDGASFVLWLDLKRYALYTDFLGAIRGHWDVGLRPREP